MKKASLQSYVINEIIICGNLQLQKYCLPVIYLISFDLDFLNSYVILNRNDRLVCVNEYG